jgi:hypothetical protein
MKALLNLDQGMFFTSFQSFPKDFPKPLIENTASEIQIHLKRGRSARGLGFMETHTVVGFRNSGQVHSPFTRMLEQLQCFPGRP